MSNNSLCSRRCYTLRASDQGQGIEMSDFSRNTVLMTVVLLAMSCGSNTAEIPYQSTPIANSEYRIGPGDALQIFVWRHDDLSTQVSVRPDGKISTPLAEDLQAAGKTPSGLARELEVVLAEYVKAPSVTVIVNNFVGDISQQIRVVGQAVTPQALQYRQGMTVLDVLIAVGGLSEFAAGNRAKIVRRQGDTQKIIKARLDDLLNRGDIRKNIVMVPGDVLIIPESRF